MSYSTFVWSCVVFLYRVWTGGHWECERGGRAENKPRGNPEEGAGAGGWEYPVYPDHH